MGHSSVKIVTLYQERNLPHLSLPRSPFYKNDRSSETLAKRQFNPLKPIKYSSPRQNAALYSRADLSRERVTKSHRFAIFSAFALRVLFCSGWKGKERKKEKRNKIKGEKRKKKEWSRNILTRADTERSNGTIEKRFARRETIQTILRFIFSPSLLLHLFFTSLSRHVRIDRLHLHNIIVYLFRRLLLKWSPVSLITLMSLHEYTRERVHVCRVYISIHV